MNIVDKAKRLWHDKRGGIATAFAVALVPLLMAAGIAVDYAFMYREQVFLQSMADAGAIAGAREMSLANATEKQIISAATASAYQSGKKHRGTAFSVDVGVDLANNQVKISLREEWQPFMAHFIYSAITPIVVTAGTRSAGQKICVIGLDEKSTATVYMRAKSRLLANNCGVISNSASSSAIRMDDSARMGASFICSAGGASGKSSAYNPDVVVDCPTYSDPLASRPAPSFGACDYTDIVVRGGNRTLSPGVYCRGLTINGKANVTFKPGIYIIKDGRFRVTDSASVYGENVGIFLAGNGSILELTKDTSISLTAPADGEMAGLLFFEDRKAVGSVHKITSNNARILLGTIYLPKSTLLVDADKSVADQSAYTAIIARKLRLEAGPVLTLNSNYGATDIPVPAGLLDVQGYGSKLVFVK
jgi:Flp pilus assembly protein TadG